MNKICKGIVAYINCYIAIQLFVLRFIIITATTYIFDYLYPKLK